MSTLSTQPISLQHSADSLFPLLSEQAKYQLQRNIDDYSANEDNYRHGMKLQKLSRIFEQAITSLYRQNLSLRAPKIAICGHVIFDGLGDLMHALYDSATLKTRLSDPLISLVLSFDNLEKRKKALEIPLAQFPDEMIVAEDFEKNREQQKKAQKALARAEVIVKVAGGSIFASLHGISIPCDRPFLSFTEYGLSIRHGSEGLGFTPGESGIVIPFEKDKTRNDCLEDGQLDALLKQQPTTASSFSYFGYLKRDFRLQDAYVALCCLTSAPDSQINMICPIKEIPGSWITADEEEFGSILRQLGLKELLLYVKDKESNHLVLKQSYIFEKQGKSLRLINPFPLSQADFELLNKRSRLFIGCTGDISFSEAFPRLPFYEIPEHKKDFFKGFLEFLRGYLEKNSPLLQFFRTLYKLNYPRECGGDYSVHYQFELVKELSKLSQSKEIQIEIHDLTLFIREHFSFNETLTDLVSREVALVRYPHLRVLENQLLDQFLKGHKALDKCYLELKKPLLTVRSLASSRLHKRAASF